MPIKGMIQRLFNQLPLPPDESIQKYDERLKRLEEELQNLKQREKSNTIIVENLNIDQLIVDKVHYENNIGSIGIKELGGRLNIGANYETDPKINKMKEKEQSSRKKQKQKQDINRTDANGPHVHFKNRQPN